MRGLLSLLLGYVVLCGGLAIGSHLASPRCSTITARHDLAVVLGAGVQPDRLSPGTLDRVLSGVNLYHSGRVRRLHMTGSGEVAGRTNGQAMAEAAVARGVPPDAVTWEGASRSTLENALFSLPYLPSATEGDVIVVTAPSHSLRGAASFWWAGRPVDFCGSEGPGATGLPLVRAMVRETAAWGLNILRGAVWRAGVGLGLGDVLPAAMLH